ncbi:uncharacterized protein MELLADRAFT_117118 [Melampsora larici-populina 98AG31]|uniref:Uncharacterized protein n=1 Tax=Melampsora larici-populina (strain 98AG31 / pathotype 3-4-7) TaxID=747676 RepID=F4RTI3_MELLP|nr:uncharacterized protein MELLADRAFT_117118 [Melampsora larici-populina 98AG31]EGG04261.1 hypothetical protein MELLADRAFT_117118 [Melampsora larici-populina 98AG31]
MLFRIIDTLNPVLFFTSFTFYSETTTSFLDIFNPTLAQQSFRDQMSDNLMGGVVSLLSSVSNTTHPYAKVADHLAAIVTPPERPTWAKVITAANIVANLWMLSAAVSTCVMRKRIGTFSLGNITNCMMEISDNLVRPNACVCFALGIIGLSTLTIIQFTWDLVAEARHTVLPGRLALPGSKFLFKWAGSCCFSWSTAAHQICGKWDPPWRPNMMAQGSPSQVPRSVVWTINITFTVLTAVVFTSITTVYSLGEVSIQKATSSTSNVVEKFRALDASGDQFSLTEALRLLQPLLGLSSVLEQMSFYMKLGALLWIIWDCLDVVIQFFNIQLTIQQKRKLGCKIGVWDTLRQIMTKNSNISSQTIDYVHEQNIMIIISGIILIACLILVPVLIWTYINSSIDEVLTANFVLINDLSISCLITLIGNVLMFKILSQTMRFYRSKRNPEKTFTTSDELRMRKSIFCSNRQVKQDEPSIFLPPENLEDPEAQISESCEWTETKAEEISIVTAVDPPTPISVRSFDK